MSPQTLFAYSLELYQQLQATNQPADAIMAKFFQAHRQLTTANRKFIVELCYQTLRLEIYYREIIREEIAANTSQRWPIDAPVNAIVPATLCLASLDQQLATPSVLSQIFATLTRLPRRQFNDLINFYQTHAALELITDQQLRFSLRHAFPDWVTSQLRSEYDLNELSDLYRALNSAPPVCLRVNSFKIGVAELQQRLRVEQIETHASQFSPFALIADQPGEIFRSQSFQAGLFELQDEGSQIISILLNAKPTARVFDACAGAGGKTLHLGALMKGRGEIFAYDINARRLANLQKRTQRAGLQNIRILTDAAALSQFRQRYAEKLDRVLIDAPCSGSGTLRRSPDIKRQLNAQLIDQMNQKQRAIINDYAQYLKPGGRLLYATCSILPAENQQIVTEFLANNSDFQLIPISQAVNEIKADYDLSRLKEISADQVMLQLLPHRHNTDGFFAAIIERQR